MFVFERISMHHENEDVEMKGYKSLAESGIKVLTTIDRTWGLAPTSLREEDLFSRSILRYNR